MPPKAKAKPPTKEEQAAEEAEEAAVAARAAAAERAKQVVYKAPFAQEWAEVLDANDDDDPNVYLRPPNGQVRHITQEVDQDYYDPKVFRLDGKDKSWFLQKGAMTFHRADAKKFRLEVCFLGGEKSRFGDEYADLSRAEQHATINWLLMIGVARGSHELTGYKDCKSSGFYFLLHCNYRRTHWRVIGCPHNSELQDPKGASYTCNPQDGSQFELLAVENQQLGIEFADQEVWLLSGGERVLRGFWTHAAREFGEEAGDAEDGKLPDVEYFPAILTSNCPTEFSAVVT